MQLFKDEVYKKLEEKLKQPSDYNRVEETLMMIKSDLRLSKLLDAYFKKNAITERARGYYGHGDMYNGTFRDRSIKILQLDGNTVPYPVALLIGVRYANQSLPILFSYHPNQDNKAEKRLFVKEESGGLYLVRIDENERIYNNKRIVDTGIFERVKPTDILEGLEKAVMQVIETKNTADLPADTKLDLPMLKSALQEKDSYLEGIITRAKNIEV